MHGPSKESEPQVAMKKVRGMSCLGKKCNCLTKIRKAEGINIDKGVGTEPVLLRVGMCLAIPEERACGQKTAQLSHLSG